MQPARINFKIYEGSTFTETFRWEAQNKGYAQINGITKAAPCVITTTSNHSIPVGWRIQVSGVSGMKEINQVGDDYYIVTATTSNTLTINQLNSTGFSQYTSGGIITYNTPVNLSVYSAVLQIRPTLDSDTVILQLTSAGGGGISINTVDSTISILIPASVTRDFDFVSAVYSMELTDTSGVVIPFLTGTVTLVREIVR
jgi:hypothetical protein